MSGYNNLYTVEQIELLRRLRNSGMTKAQVVEAFDSLDRLDEDFGDTYSVPTNLTYSTASPSSFTRQRFSSTAVNRRLMSSFMENGSSPAVNGYATSCSMSSQVCPQSPLEMKCTPIFHLNDKARPSSNSHQLPQTSDEDSDDLKEFMSMGRDVMYDMVKNFVHKFSIKQTQIGAVAGVSQAYVSKYLRGDYSEMSDRVCKAIYTWFINAKKHVASLMSQKVAQQNGKSGVMTPEEFAMVPRRERFTFRQCHLDLLEQSFKEDPYPSYEKRECIANALNDVLSASGRDLSEREKVNPNIVSNWFANKRKELKRLSKDIDLYRNKDGSKFYSDQPFVELGSVPILCSEAGFLNGDETNGTTSDTEDSHKMSSTWNSTRGDSCDDHPQIPKLMNLPGDAGTDLRLRLSGADLERDVSISHSDSFPRSNIMSPHANPDIPLSEERPADGLKDEEQRRLQMPVFPGLHDAPNIIGTPPIYSGYWQGQ